MDEVINVGMNKINKTPEAVKATANSSLKEASYTDQKNLCVRFFIRFSEKV